MLTFRNKLQSRIMKRFNYGILATNLVDLENTERIIFKICDKQNRIYYFFTVNEQISMKIKMN